MYLSAKKPEINSRSSIVTNSIKTLKVVQVKKKSTDTHKEDQVRTQQTKETGLGRNQPCRHLELGLPASRTEGIHCCCASHSVCGILLRWPWQIQTGVETEICRNTAASAWSSYAALDSMDVLVDVDVGGGIDPGIFPAQRIRDECCHSPERIDESENHRW